MTLGVTSDRFTINGQPKFLVFVSDFDAMDVAPPDLQSDFAYFKSRGVDCIRIFPNWWDVRQDMWTFPQQTFYFASDTLIAPNGSLQDGAGGPLDRFLQALDIAKAEGLLVDVSFSAETVNGLSRTNYQNAIANVASLLTNYGSAYKHVLFDLQNEYNENGAGGAPFTDSQIQAIRNAVNVADPDRIVTASISSSDTAGTAASKETTANVDSIAWHEDRNPSFWNRVGSAISAIQNVNPDPPIYLQEPTRLQTGTGDNRSWLTSNGFGADVHNAYVDGAAAWCFHNGGSFRMDGSNLQAMSARCRRTSFSSTSRLLTGRSIRAHTRFP